jgi:hypothetical protein
LHARRKVGARERGERRGDESVDAGRVGEAQHGSARIALKATESGERGSRGVVLSGCSSSSSRGSSGGGRSASETMSIGIGSETRSETCVVGLGVAMACMRFAVNSTALARTVFRVERAVCGGAFTLAQAMEPSSVGQ